MMATRGLYRGPAGQDEPAEPPAQPARPGLLTAGLGMRSAGPASPWRWFFSAIWLVYLVAPVSALFGHGHGSLWIAGGLAITIAFCVAYVWLLARSIRRLAVARIWLLVLAALAALACVVYGKDWTPLWIYVSAATGMILAGTSGGRRAAMRGVFAVGACYVFFSWLSHDDPSDFFVVLLPVLLIGLAMIGFRLQIELMQELAQARGTVAKLAANDERLRLARDMHDLTGQSLSMITLKAELAAKRLSRLQPSAERDAALSELGDIGRGQPPDAARHPRGGHRLPPPNAGHRGHHGQERAGGGGDPARRRSWPDPALRRAGRRSRGGPGLVPARGGDQRDPALRRDGLPDPADREFRRALPRNRR